MPKEAKKKTSKPAPAAKPKGKAKAAPAPKKPSKPERFYPADDLPAAKVKQMNGPTKLRGSITPGTVLILLSGRFRGKRVVFLKQLSSGLLLVTGPYKVNGVPIKRVNQSYVIATSVKVDISSVALPAIDDAYFAREEAEEVPEGDEDKFFSQASPKKEVPAQRKADQEALDAALEPIIGGVEMLQAYLQAKFSLKKNDKPHEMLF